MNTVELQELFEPRYGNKFDANKMVFNEHGDINFISRTSHNNGCVGKVNQYSGITPYASVLSQKLVGKVG